MIATAAPLTNVNVGYTALTGTQATVWYAQEKGLFGKYGLKVNLVSLPGGAKAAMTLISGDMDILQIAAPPIVNAAAAKKDVVIVAGLINLASGSLIAQPGITSMKSLKGKIVGTNDGASSYTITRLLLEANNLDPDRDVVLLNVGGDPERAAALKAKKVDAIFIVPPLTYDLKNSGYIEICNASEEKILYQATSIATTRKFLNERRQVATAFMKAVLEAIKRIKQDPDGSKAVLAKYMSLDPSADAKLLQDTYQTVLLGTLEVVPYPTVKGLQAVIDIAAKENPDAAALKSKDIIDTSLLDELKKNGFISNAK
jgi:ABC-type nitrate/sulfonate/bicarbonate transport system substrate-binding protein